MPREIYIFETIKEAKRILSTFNSQFTYPKNSVGENSKIIKTSVSGNVFRAFAGTYQSFGIRPFEIYRSWAKENFGSITNTISKINKISEYDNFIYGLNDSLLNHWREKTNNSNHKLGYGPSIKMINLLIKTIMEEENYYKPKLIPFLHVPFDQYSLTPLINIINDLTGINYRINILKSVTMQFVNTKELYEILLKAIRKLLSDSQDIHPIIYDYWSWNDKH